jgi:hypothetical protein
MLVPIDDFRETINDPNYVEGSIEIQIGEDLILSRETWDYVDQLWAYIVTGLEEVTSDNQSYSTYFPDQPIELRLERSNNALKFRISSPSHGSKSSVVDYNTAVKSLIKSADSFFRILIRHLPDRQPTYDYQLERIAKLKKVFSSE